MSAIDERQLALSDYLRTVRYSSIEDLVTRFGVSVATIHRDLAALVRTGAVRKVHGGAISTLPEAMPVQTSASSGQRDSHFIQRLETNQAAKMLIAERAERSIVAGDIVFLDSSTTCLCLARRLQSSRLNNLSIVTNSVLIAQEFYRFPPISSS
jgi:DeoR/GlpR family transcriptional regulator of sugar metabolism